MNEQELFVTVVGFNHYYGKKPFIIGNQFQCVKEPDNEYDTDAIKVEMPGFGTVGYIANSPHTKADGTLTAGRIYDRVSKKFSVQVLFTTCSKVICKVMPTDEPKRRYKFKRIRRDLTFDENLSYESDNQSIPF